MFVSLPAIVVVRILGRHINSPTKTLSLIVLFLHARSVQLRAYSPGKQALAVLPLVLLALVRCQLITKEGSFQVAEASAVKVVPVAGNNNRSRVSVVFEADGVPRFLVQPPMQTLSISFYDPDSKELLWVAVPKTFSLASGQVLSGTPQRGRSDIDDPGYRNELGAGSDSTLEEPLGEFLYGSPPEGFHQLLPTAGGPRPLEREKRYLLVINGELTIRVTFSGNGVSPDTQTTADQ